MALCKHLRGGEANLANQPLHDGYIYYTVDTKSMFIDHIDGNGNLVRSQLSAECANKLRYIKDGETVEINPAELLLNSNKVTSINNAVTHEQIPSALAVKNYITENLSTTDRTILVDYKLPLSWNGAVAGLTSVAVDETSSFYKVSDVACKYSVKLSEGKSGSASFGVNTTTLYSPTISDDICVYTVNDTALIVSALNDNAIYNELQFPSKGTYFLLREDESGKVWISLAVQDIMEYDHENMPNAVLEAANNKINVISSSVTDDQYPSAKATKEYVDDSIAEIPNTFSFENTTNKVTTIDKNSNNTQYPSALAVKTYVENSVVIPDLTGYEQTSNKVTNIVDGVTDMQYPSAKAIKDYVDSNAIIPDLSGYEVTTNKTTTINSSSTDTQYPSAKSVKQYVDNAIPDVSKHEITTNKVVALDESVTDNQYPSAKAVKDYIDENTISKLPDLDGYEEKVNKITVISDEANDTQYPSAQAVKTYVDNVVPDVSGFEETINRVETINDLASNQKYPTSLAVKTYVDNAIETVNTYEKNVLIDYETTLTWDGDTTDLVFLTNLYYGSSFYKISDTPIISNIKGVTLVEAAGDTPYDINVDSSVVYSPDTSNAEVYVYRCGQENPLIVSVLKDNVTYEEKVFPIRGTYFMLRDYSAPYGQLWVSSVDVLKANYNHPDMTDVTLEVANNKVTEILGTETSKQYPTAQAVKNYIDTAIADVSVGDHVPVEYGEPLTWDGDTTGLTSVYSGEEYKYLYKVSDAPLPGSCYFTEGYIVGTAGSIHISVDEDLVYAPIMLNNAVYRYGSSDKPFAYSILEDGAQHGDIVFPTKGTYFLRIDMLQALGQSWIASAIPCASPYNSKTMHGVVAEVQANRVTTINDASTDKQYPTAKAVRDYVISNTSGTPSLEGYEQTTNKATVINESSTDTQYPSSLAVKDYVEQFANNAFNTMAESDAQVLTEAKSYADSKLADIPNDLPTGGTLGQVLRKKSATDYDVEWATVSGEGGGSIAQQQANWNQNDSSQVDYILNRPFYEEEAIIEETIIAEQELSFAYYDSFGVYGCDLSEVIEPPLTVGTTYKVKWDGVEYTCTGQAVEAYSGLTLLGNVIAYGGTGNDEPFAIVCNQEDGGTSLASFDTAATHTVGISKFVMTTNVHKIDPKYLPDATPTFDLAALGMGALTMDGTATEFATDTTEIMAALDKGPVKFTMLLNHGGVLSATLMPLNIKINDIGVYLCDSRIVLDEDSVIQLTITDGAIAASWMALSQTGTASGLPEVTTADNGKFLRVVDGAWVAVTLTDVSIEGA